MLLQDHTKRGCQQQTMPSSSSLQQKQEDDDNNGVVVVFFYQKHFFLKRRRHELNFSSCIAPKFDSSSCPPPKLINPCLVASLALLLSF
jgi:hypothetical protein